MTALTGSSGKPINLSVAGNGALCAIGRKCVRKDGHDGACWPADPTASAEDGETKKEDA